MSRPRSRSPCYRLSPRWHDDRRDGGGRGPPRNFPSDRPDVDPHWNGPRFDNHRLRPKEDPEKPWAGFREEGGPGGRRRPSGSPPDPHRHRRAPLEELRRRTPSPFGSVDRRRLSPDHELRDRGRGGRGRGGFGEDPQRYGDQQREKFGEVAGSPQRLPRERLPSAGSRKTGGSQAGGAWGREEGRSRPRSPREMSQDQRRERSGGEQGRGGQSKPREDHNPPPHHHHPLHQRERSPFPDRLRKELEDEVHHGYEMDKEPLRGRHGSLDKRPPAGGFGGGPLREGGAPQTLVVEHAHGMADAQRGEKPFRHAPRREPFGKHLREHGDGQDDGRERRPGLAGSSSQERFRMSDRRSKVRESQEKEEERLRGRPVHDHRRDLEFLARDLGGAGRERGARFGDDGTRQQSVRRIPPLPPPPLPPPPRQGRHNSPFVGFHGQEARMEVPPRGRHSPPGPGGTGRIPGRGGRLQGPPGSRDRTQARSHYHPQQQGPQHRPREDYARPSPRGEDWDLEPRDEHPLWGGDPEEPPTRHWDSLDGGARRLPPQRGDPRCGPGTPRKRQAADERWNTEEPETMATGKDRLTIKVDLNRTQGQNSQLCYSTDRQLSLDLVNVGRQRLDFLPMLEHSGTYRENAAHTGTFAQEIITLVHHVKDHYFHGNGVTLNQRFSGPQDGGAPDDEEEEEDDDEEEMVEERMTLNRRFNMNLNNGMSAGEHVHSRLGDLQPAMRQHQMIHDPGDLRYDLERRRQERLGEVKVTIPGGSMSQRPLVHRSEREEEFVDGVDMMPQEVWSRHQEQDGRRGGDTRPQRRGDPFLHPGPHKRSNHHGNQPPGPVRGQHRSHVIGAGW